MRRPRIHKAAGGVSLFPFLAVLICTMGALIVLLVLVVQLARVKATEDTREAQLPPDPDALRAQQEDYQWRREMLQTQRSQMLDEEASRRLELSHLEEHIRELEKKWELLRETAADLRHRLTQQGAGQEGTEEELQQLQESIRQAKKELEETRARADNQPPVYAIVPYDGPNGTRRRPIYIECRGDGVVIQPEGVRLSASDFRGPLGPGNPLDAALRAIREYHADLGPAGSQGDPYPLLLVRPDGVENYAVARAALGGWEDEFGYELIDESMRLKFPEADPTLTQLIGKAIADARSRQAVLAAAMPRQYGEDPDIGFVASPSSGGFQPASGTARFESAHRPAGFGRGGDDRYGAGRAAAHEEGEAAPDSTPGPPGHDQAGHAQGQPNATVGAQYSPLADKRGRNWGLPQANNSATGIVRPMRLAVLPDRLIILPDLDERRAPEVVMVRGDMVEEIDEFVSKVWDRIEQWGMAVAGGYWKPVLHVTVAQGADERFRELQGLLEGSGLEVRRSKQ